MAWEKEHDFDSMGLWMLLRTVLRFCFGEPDAVQVEFGEIICIEGRDSVW